MPSEFAPAAVSAAVVASKTRLNVLALTTAAAGPAVFLGLASRDASSIVEVTMGRIGHAHVLQSPPTALHAADTTGGILLCISTAAGSHAVRCGWQKSF